MRQVAAFAVLLLVAGCATDGTPSTTPTQATTSTTSVPTSTLPPVVDCPGVGEFEEGRGIADFDSESSDSRRLGRISWDTSDQCETFVFQFETAEGAPATTPPAIEVNHLDSFQVVRVALGIDSAGLADQLVETNLVERLYVVRSLTGELFVDLHLDQPAAVRVSSSSSPARLTLELRPGFVDFEGEAALDDRVVVISPTTGNEVEADVRLLGYAQTSEGTVGAIVTQEDTVVAELETTAAESPNVWGEFRLDVTLPPGPVSVFVGEADDDGGLDGVSLDLTVN